MSACPDKEMLLHGLLDGELDAANAAAFEAHLKTCAGCAEELRALQGLRGRITAPGVAYRAPDLLRQRIEAMAATPAPRPRRLRAAAPWAMSGVFAALAASLAVMLSLPDTARLEDQLIASHVRSTMEQHLVDVQTSDRHTVKPWFNGRVDFAPPVVDLKDEGFPLVGGRLDYIDSKVVAAIVYRRNKHVVNLFVWKAHPGLTRADLTRNWPAQPHAGYAVEHWSENGLEFWAVSDIEPRDLSAFHQAFAKQTHS